MLAPVSQHTHEKPHGGGHMPRIIWVRLSGYLRRFGEIFGDHEEWIVGMGPQSGDMLTLKCTHDFIRQDGISKRWTSHQMLDEWRIGVRI
jgi:hypothetical protein